MADREPMTPDTEALAASLGTLATVVFDEHVSEPRTADDDAKQAWRDIGPGYLDDIEIVSVYSFHVALYALQNPTPENIRKALYLIGTSGDCDEATDADTLMPLQLPLPSGWDREWIPEELR